MKRVVLTLLALIISMGLRAEEPSQWVDPFIGTADYSVTHPGAIVPHGMMAAVPFNVTGSTLNRYDKDNRWWSAPYDIRNRYSVGFAHGALSGVGCPELGAVITMPTIGEILPDRYDHGSTYYDEVAEVGYYATTYEKYAVRAEATATERASVERYTFLEGGEANILV
ncbi:MAG: glycoside hydrolase family 92 protein, partial [Alistipes sp.]|nr:glycoside hydrolase family 92 protein [Alistipes sp.]